MTFLHSYHCLYWAVSIKLLSNISFNYNLWGWVYTHKFLNNKHAGCSGLHTTSETQWAQGCKWISDLAVGFWWIVQTHTACDYTSSLINTILRMQFSRFRKSNLFSVKLISLFQRTIFTGDGLAMLLLIFCFAVLCYSVYLW